MMELTPRSPDDPSYAPTGAWRGPSDAQKHADAVVAEARVATRRPLFRPPPPKPAVSQDVIEIRLAEEITYIRRMLDQMGDALSDDPILLNRHGQTLQGFDRIGQMLGHVARIVESADRKAAIETAMPEMRGRLERRSLFAA